MPSWYHGSSPRLRGTLPDLFLGFRNLRFIPAPAGNTPARRFRSQTAAVHPRACGEHPLTRLAPVRAPGSSPRLRGTPSNGSRAKSFMRFIPAPAGNTFALTWSSIISSVHPRACGEHATSVPASGRQRFIPAPAGNTSEVLPLCRPLSVHPRACGEHLPTIHWGLNFTGSSPRLRGTHRPHVYEPRPERFIPAPAGNTQFGVL